MRDPIEEWRQAGVEVVIVGNGTSDFAEAFREDFELEGLLLVDPDLHAYRAAGLRRGRREIASTRLFGNALRAFRSGARQSAVQGDPWQLGGVLVFGPGGELRFVHRSEVAGDHADPDDISAALEASAPTIVEDLPEPSALAPIIDAARPVLDVSPLFSFDRIGYQRHAIGFDPADLDVDLYGTRSLVTGANAGIGYETALALADLGSEVVLLCRDAARGQAAAKEIREATGNRRVEVFEVDMSSREAVDKAVAALSSEPVDVLVHNAGVLPDERIVTEDGLELTFAVHVAGPHRLTRGLAPALERSDAARVVFVSSGGMLTRSLQVEDPQWQERDYDGVMAYAETKRAQVVLAELWAEHFMGTSVHVNSMHPGWANTRSVKTSLPRFHEVTKPILRTPAEGADTVVWLAASPAAADRTGSFFFDRQAVRTHWLPKTQETPQQRRALWQMCEDLS